MNHYVPDFEMDDDYQISTSSCLTRPKKSSMHQDDEIMELVWQNGPVVMQNQTQRSLKKTSTSAKYHDAVTPAEPSIRPPQEHQHHQLFMQEDEMVSWLHYPLNDANFDQDFCADLLYSSATCVTSASASASADNATHPTCTVQNMVNSPPSEPPIPQGRRPETVQNFAHFSRHRAVREASDSDPSKLKTVVRESTVVDSNDTPAVASASRTSEAAVARSIAGASTPIAVTSGGSKRECDNTVTSSPGGSSASAETATFRAPVEDRKRKGKDEDTDYHSEDAEFEYADVKKQARGSTSTKRSRAAEVHNLSERRRRDRINEKMRALQELIPRCNKSDKASMLDEAIEYLKSLQLQVQMMSMGCSMVPMMFPGVQQYMAPMGMGMGVGMGMELGMNRPIMPYPNVLAGSHLPTPGTAAHMGSRFPMPTFHMPPVPPPDPSRIQAANHPDTLLSSLGQHQNQPRMPNFIDPYQQYLGLHPHSMQVQVPQNQAMAVPNASKPTTSEGAENTDNNQSG
ncbi:hypothetical protein K2173_012769 [Erythroxylum novogranatense]|uniref:BHLH domain-containing protein n=1 Tax=Erythroxylum novogranatense TaxID=1862640 RepID=A0AAV8U9R8_9ROSI|nr:hypothetical protein K2173_012769 [Erythroxylum novogranatense]